MGVCLSVSVSVSVSVYVSMCVQAPPVYLPVHGAASDGNTCVILPPSPGGGEVFTVHGETCSNHGNVDNDNDVNDDESQNCSLLMFCAP